MRGRPVILMMASLLVCALAACSPKADFNARFVRYETLQDGLVVAVVKPVDVEIDPLEERAYVSRRDLEPGDLVGVRVTGRDWDVPQWRPDREIVAPLPE